MTKETVKTGKASVYEVGYHIVPAVSPEKLSHEVDAIHAVLKGAGATVISEEAPKLRNLSYQMTKIVGPVRNHYDTAYFGWIKFEGSGDTIADITKSFEANEKVLRFLLVKTVRENTLYGAKILPEAKDEALVKPEEVVAAPVEELDKSIDKLVA